MEVVNEKEKPKEALNTKKKTDNMVEEKHQQIDTKKKAEDMCTLQENQQKSEIRKTEENPGEVDTKAEDSKNKRNIAEANPMKSKERKTICMETSKENNNKRSNEKTHNVTYCKNWLQNVNPDHSLTNDSVETVQNDDVKQSSADTDSLLDITCFL